MAHAVGGFGVVTEVNDSSLFSNAALSNIDRHRRLRRDSSDNRKSTHHPPHLRLSLPPPSCYFPIGSPGVAELADAADSKSAGDHSPCGFDSLLRDHPLTQRPIPPPAICYLFAAILRLLLVTDH